MSLSKLIEAVEPASTFYIDCEFDGHNGPILSIAMVRDDGYSLHITCPAESNDEWVVNNVLPILSAHNAHVSMWLAHNEVGPAMRAFIGDVERPVIIADSPVDIGRFCRAISTEKDGGWASTRYPQMTFVVHNVDCYPTTLEGAVRHNAWWDAVALRAILRALEQEGR